MIDFSNWKCRSHALGNIMSAGKDTITDKQIEQIKIFQVKEKLTEKQGAELKRLIKKRDNPGLSATCKSYLIECYTTLAYSRDKDVYSKFMEKGLMVEEDAITLYCLLKEEYLKKNEVQLENAYITGKPDLRKPSQKHVIDIKSSWDVHTFLKAKVAGIDTNYEWQVQGYEWLDNAETGSLAYCLIDTPEPLIQKEVNKLMWNMGAATNQSPEFLEAKEALENILRFGDIPREERMHEKFVRRDDKKINQIPDRVKECREWMAELNHNLTSRLGVVSLEEIEF